MESANYSIFLVNEVIFEEQSPSASKANEKLKNNDNYCKITYNCIIEYYTNNNEKTMNKRINHDDVIYSKNIPSIEKLYYTSNKNN